MSNRLSPNDHINKLRARARVAGDRGRVTRHEVAEAVRAGCVVEAMIRLDHEDIDRTLRLERLPRYTHWRWLADGTFTMRASASVEHGMVEAEREALVDLALLIVDACDFSTATVPDHAMVLRGRGISDRVGNELVAPTIILIPAGPIERHTAGTIGANPA